MVTGIISEKEQCCLVGALFFHLPLENTLYFVCVVSAPYPFLYSVDQLSKCSRMQKQQSGIYIVILNSLGKYVSCTVVVLSLKLKI